MLPLCVSSCLSVKDAATLLRPAAAVRGPAALPLLGPALRAERLLGFRHGQHGQHGQHDDDDEGRGRRLGRRGDPPP